jgi:hypothetical protein
MFELSHSNNYHGRADNNDYGTDDNDRGADHDNSGADDNNRGTDHDNSGADDNNRGTDDNNNYVACHTDECGTGQGWNGAERNRNGA